MRGLHRKSRFAVCAGPERQQPAVAAVLSAVTVSGWRNLVDRATSDITGSSVWLSGRFLSSFVTVCCELCRDGNEGRCLFFPACARDVAVVILRGGDGYVVGTFLGACRDN